MLRAAIYARYSSDLQNQTTIDDQIRKCRQIANDEGFLVEEKLIFTDLAISGHAKDIRKREGLSKLFDAWDGGFLDVVLTTEMSRLGRDAAAGLQVLARLNDGRVHLLTADGVDTRKPGWMMLALIRLGLASEEARTLSARVSRSMLGVLERGGLIAPPPIGYALDLQTLRDPNRAEGVLWRIDPETASVVREIFSMRSNGLSVFKIARALNDRAIPASRRLKNGLPALWRGGSVYRVLCNSIYKGVFVYGGSSFSVTKSRRSGVPLSPKAFERPHLRIVDDDVWHRCNPPASARKLRGGVKHVLAGLISCARCPSVLSVKITSASGSGTLACPQCEQRSRCEAGSPKAEYTSPRAALAALHAVLLDVVSETGAMQEVRSRLRERLKSGPAAELLAAQTAIKQLTTIEARLLELAVQPSVGLEVVGSKLSENRSLLATARARLQELEREAGRVTHAEVERQCSVSAAELIEKILAGEPSVLQVRAMLSRLVTKFTFVARPSRGQAEFEIILVPGALMALAAGSKDLDDRPVTYRVTTRIDWRSKTNVFTDVRRIK